MVMLVVAEVPSDEKAGLAERVETVERAVEEEKTADDKSVGDIEQVDTSVAIRARLGRAEATKVCACVKCQSVEREAELGLPDAKTFGKGRWESWKMGENKGG
jgi:hypothetical protein